MAEQHPFVDSDRRPDLRLDLDRQLGDITVREFGVLISDARFKSFADGVSEKNVTGDKQSADKKLSSDFKSHNDKVSKDLNDTGPAGIGGFTDLNTDMNVILRYRIDASQSIG